MNCSIEAATILESFFLLKDLFKMYKILPLYPFPSTSWDALLIPNPFVATSGKKNSPPIRSTQLLSLGRCSHLRLNNSSKMGQIDTIFLEFWQKEIFLSFLGLRIACLYRNHPLLDLVFFFQGGWDRKWHIPLVPENKKMNWKLDFCNGRTRKEWNVSNRTISYQKTRHVWIVRALRLFPCFFF